MLLSPALPDPSGPTSPSHVVRLVPPRFRRELLGWAGAAGPDPAPAPGPDAARRARGSSTSWAPRAARPDARCWRACPSTAAALDRRCPPLVIGAGVDRLFPERRQRATGRVAGRRVPAVRRALPLRPGDRRGEPRAGRRRDPACSWSTTASEPVAAAAGSTGAPVLSSRPAAPHSSRGPGHRPLKAEITGSNPVCGTSSPLLPLGYTPLRIVRSGDSSGRPGPRGDRERGGGSKCPAALPKLRLFALVQAGYMGTRGTYPERERLPPFLECRVLKARGEDRRLRVLETHGGQQIDEVALACPRQPELVIDIGIELTGGLPEQGERAPATSDDPRRTPRRHRRCGSPGPSRPDPRSGRT